MQLRQLILSSLDKEIERAVEDDIAQAKIKVDLALEKAKTDKHLHEFEQAAMQIELDRALRSAKEQQLQEHARTKDQLQAREFENLLKLYSVFSDGAVAQDSATVAVLDRMEGYQRPGGAKAILESDLIKPEDIFSQAKPSR